MANGFLTGKYDAHTKFEGNDDFRTRMPQYTEEGYAKAKGLLELLNRLAQEKNATSAQISLAWMICKKPYIIPIPGSRKPERLRENLAAGEITLTAAEIADIDCRLDDMEFDVFGGHSGK
jgi:aryl-alcohol dehydrogenase-like predicted oxidoreductase